MTSAQLRKQAVDRALGPAQIAAAEDIQVVERVAEIVQPLAHRIIRRQQPGLLGALRHADAKQQKRHRNPPETKQRPLRALFTTSLCHDPWLGAKVDDLKISSSERLSLT